MGFEPIQLKPQFSILPIKLFPNFRVVGFEPTIFYPQNRRVSRLHYTLKKLNKNYILRFFFKRKPSECGTGNLISKPLNQRNRFTKPYITKRKPQNFKLLLILIITLNAFFKAVDICGYFR